MGRRIAWAVEARRRPSRVRIRGGRPRRVPMNATVRAALVDLASDRARPDDPDERLFPLSYRQTQILFAQAVVRAQGMLRDAGQEPSRLDGITWHSLRHTFASRLVMAGVDLRTVAELGGWRTLAMVQRYAHLSPDHLTAAVERLVEVSRKWPDGTTPKAEEGAVVG